MQIRIGHGYDAHRFAAQGESGATITIGGVRIAHTHRLMAHSDGDVLVHALCDALLGALALGDIGRHFPDSDPQYRGIDSMELLKRILTLVRAKGWELGNADITLIGQAPRFAPHASAMRAALATAARTAPESISVKATTTEGLGFEGRGEGLACHAVVLLIKGSS